MCQWPTGCLRVLKDSGFIEVALAAIANMRHPNAIAANWMACDGTEFPRYGYAGSEAKAAEALEKLGEMPNDCVSLGGTRGAGGEEREGREKGVEVGAGGA